MITFIVCIQSFEYKLKFLTKLSFVISFPQAARLDQEHHTNDLLESYTTATQQHPKK